MKESKIILKHYEEDSDSLNRQYKFFENIQEAIRCADKKHKVILKEIADEVNKNINNSLSRIDELTEAWEKLMKKFYKGKYGKENIILYPYEINKVSHYVFCLCVNLDDKHAGISNEIIDFEDETHDFELEEITKDDFIAEMTKHELDVVNYRLNK
jgi:hypothetical protein